MISMKKGIAKITSGTKEWATYNVNCIDGCYNDCRYCYAKIMAIRFGRHTPGTWKHMKLNIRAVEKKYTRKNGRVMFPSSHDIFEFPEIKEACIVILSKLVQTGNKVLITTKPRLAITKEIVRRMRKYESQIQFRFTITSVDNELLTFWEPNAPTFEERMASLKYAYLHKYKTSVSIEPFLDKDPTDLIEMVSPYVSESIWIGKMNYISRENVQKRYQYKYDNIRENYTDDNMKTLFYKLRHNPKIRFKDSFMIKLGSNYI